MKHFDVIIAGGGPAGATLGALLAKRTKLSVAIFEKDEFPRDHIGESFAQRTTTVLEESGALEKVLASECYVRKYGGYYAWGDGAPAVSLFEHGHWEQDGVLRWTVHAHRAEFDEILLDHARSTGVDVTEGVAVKGVEREGGTSELSLSDGTKATCKIFVEATGRVTSLLGSKMEYLSSYKNIAIWNHFTGGRVSQSVDEEWNLFHQLEKSAIANMAFEDGWFWYIPIRRVVNGKHQLVHSVGMVTDPQVLQQEGKDYTSLETFCQKAKTVPILKDLVANAEPIQQKMHTATNYSMIRDHFCSFDDGWMTVGDSAYFIDPLFSSGVAFGLSHAAGAAFAIEAALGGEISEAHCRDLWHDYDISWRKLAKSFSLMIDQWYHAIAVCHPESVYWKTRIPEAESELRDKTFNALVDTGVSPDLLFVVSRGEGTVESLGTEGPLVETLSALKERVLPQGIPLRLKGNVEWRKSVTMRIGVSKTALARMNFEPEEAKRRLSLYWSDPVKNGDVLPPLYDKAYPCYRIYFNDVGGSAAESAEFLFVEERDKVLGMLSELRAGGPTLAELRERLSQQQLLFLDKLLQANMVEPVA